MTAGLIMDAYPIGPSIRKCRDKLVRVFNHQVAVKRQVCGLAQRLHHRGPERNIGDEVPVHHIYMDDAAAAALRRGNLVGKARKISRKYGGNQLNHDIVSVSSLVHQVLISGTGKSSAAFPS